MEATYFISGIDLPIISITFTKKEKEKKKKRRKNHLLFFLGCQVAEIISYGCRGVVLALVSTKSTWSLHVSNTALQQEDRKSTCTGKPGGFYLYQAVCKGKEGKRKHCNLFSVML